MTSARITLLVEDLSRLAEALPADRRYPSLERILARGTYRRIPAESPNHLRFRLFGQEPPGQLPVAALTHASMTGNMPEAGSYWLRADPVTMQADMVRVFMTACGFADCNPSERAMLSGVIRDALALEAIDLPDSPAPWSFRLDAPLEFEFTPLHEALGMDVSEALPNHVSARAWKRIMTDIQVDLHQCAVNAQRRADGRREINSVWFWGGGSMPEPLARTFETVVSNDPVSRGLGMLSDAEVCTPDAWAPGEGRLLIDWGMPTQDALKEAEATEQLAARLLQICGRSGLSLDLVDGSGAAWRIDRASRFRIWSRTTPLAQAFRRFSRK